MLGSILRVAIFLSLIAVLIVTVNHLMSTPGGITISFAGREFFFTPLAFVAGVLLAFALLWLGLKLLGLLIACFRFVMGDETALTRYLNRSRERRGLEALAGGMTDLAAGDAGRARAKAEKAEKYLNRPELTCLLNAQVAEQTGDTEKAKVYYKAMADDPKTAFVGVRGLLKQAIIEGQSEKALKLAQTAANLKPKDEEVLDTLYTLQSQSFDWSGARRTLAAQKRIGVLPKDEAARRDSMLALAQAMDAEELGETEHARKLAVEAAKIDPTNSEAVAVASRQLCRAGSKRAATRLIVDAWRREPTAELAAAFAAIEPDESPGERLRRFDRLLDANGTALEARFTRAELALVSEDFKLARRTLERIEEEEPSQRYCAIMAAVIRGEGGPDAEIRAWLARAVGAPRGGDSVDGAIQAALSPLLSAGAPADVEDAETADPEAQPEVQPQEKPAA